MKWYHIRYDDDNKERISRYEIKDFVNKKLVPYIGKKVKKQFNCKEFNAEVIFYLFLQK